MKIYPISYTHNSKSLQNSSPNFRAKLVNEKFIKKSEDIITGALLGTTFATLSATQIAKNKANQEVQKEIKEEIENQDLTQEVKKKLTENIPLCNTENKKIASFVVSKPELHPIFQHILLFTNSKNANFIQTLCEKFLWPTKKNRKPISKLLNAIVKINGNLDFIEKTSQKTGMNFSEISALIKYTNSRTIKYLEEIFEKESVNIESENFESALNFIDHAINNIPESAINTAVECINPTNLNYAKALMTNLPNLNFDNYPILLNPKTFDKIKTFSNKKSILNYNLPDKEYCEFIKLANLALEYDKSGELVMRSINSCDPKDFDIKKFRGEVFELVNTAKKNICPYTSNKDLITKSYSKEIKDFLTNEDADLDTIFCAEFINTVNPENKDILKTILEKRSVFDFSQKKLFFDIYSNTNKYKTATNIIKNLSSKCDSDILFSLVEASLKHRANLSEKECEKIINKIYNYYLKITNNEDLYLNQNTLGYNAKDIFLLNTESLVHLFYVFDENTIETLFRKRLNYVHNYLQEFESYELKEDILDLLKDLSASKKEKRKPLSEQEKLNLLYILKTHISKKMDLSKLKNMAENRAIDLFELYKDLYNNLFQIIGYSEKEISEIPKEKLFSWNLQYMPLIYQSLEKNMKGFRTLFNASFKDDFITFIHDEKSSLGKANNKTKELFQKNWINYEKWLNPSKENEVRLVATSQTGKSMIEIADKLITDIENLRQTGLKTFFDRRYANFIKDDEFRIPQDILNSKTKLSAFIKNILTQLEPAWKRANTNKNDKNGNKNFNASKTLEIKRNFEERLSEVHKLNNDKENQVLDLTIKMWDRVPQKDLFQGNYSTCCIRMGGSNGHVMPNYILNTAFNMIEIFDNISGKVIGNALCYFAKDSTETLNFIIDNIEINNSMIPSKDVSEKLINAVIQYASNVCKDVTGKSRTICIGTNYNTLAINKKTCDDTITLLGNIDCERIYLDAYGGWIHTSLLKHKSSLHKIY